MPYDEHLSERVRKVFKDKRVAFRETKMMGGICFMVKDKLCAGVDKDRLIARVGEENYSKALKRKYCKPFDITKKPLKGFVLVDAEGVDKDKDLDYWLQLCIDYNPKAKSSKKK